MVLTPLPELIRALTSAVSFQKRSGEWTHGIRSRVTSSSLLVSITNKEVAETETSFLTLDRRLNNGPIWNS